LATGYTGPRLDPRGLHVRWLSTRGPHQLFIHPDECIDWGACEPVCPVTAIFTEDEVPEPAKPFIELNKQFFVDHPGVASVSPLQAGSRRVGTATTSSGELLAVGTKVRQDIERADGKSGAARGSPLDSQVRI